ncbi:MAG: hypothetical protein ACOC89_01250 [Candidatus Saliniplasma sp.]
MSTKTCQDCVYFIAHDSYNYIGYCKRKKEISFSDDECPKVKEVELKELKKVLEEQGWVYCETCKKPIYDVKELKNHTQGKIVWESFPDDVAAEESPGGD